MAPKSGCMKRDSDMCYHGVRRRPYGVAKLRRVAKLRTMTWLSYGISVILLVSVIFEYRLKHIDTDRRTTAHKRTRTFVLVIAIVSIAAQQVVAEVKDRRKSKVEADLRGKVEQLVVQQSELLTALSTNNAIDPKLRVEILEHSHAVEIASADMSDLESWKTDFKNEQAAAKHQERVARMRHQIAHAEQSAANNGRVERTWKRATPMFNFIIQTLQSLVRDIARSRSEKLYSDYSGLSTTPLGDKVIHIATITTGTKLGWSFEVTADAIPRGANYAEVWLRVQASCSNQVEKTLYQTMFSSSEIPGNPGSTNMNAESYLMLTPSHADFAQSVDLTGYQTNVLGWVHRFLAAHSIRCDGR